MTPEMEHIRRKNQSSLKMQHQLFVSACIAAILLLALFLCAAATVSSNSSKSEFDKTFVFGDSSVDTGNLHGRRPSQSKLGAPYGRTYTGVPGGRFSDGKVLSDHLADCMRLKPRPCAPLAPQHLPMCKMVSALQYQVLECVTIWGTRKLETKSPS